MNIRYRKATIEDIPKLNPLLSQLSDSLADPAVMAQKMEKLDRNEDCFLLVAENTENGDLCGSLLGVAFEDICGDCKPILLVENVVTDEAYRGRGVGRGMFAFIEDWGREKGMPLLHSRFRPEPHRRAQVLRRDRLQRGQGLQEVSVSRAPRPWGAKPLRSCAPRLQNRKNGKLKGDPAGSPFLCEKYGFRSFRAA